MIYLEMMRQLKLIAITTASTIQNGKIEPAISWSWDNSASLCANTTTEFEMNHTHTEQKDEQKQM